MAKVAVVTGAGSGIGREVAVAFLKAGYSVALAGRRIPEMEETVELAGGAGQALIVSTDVSQPAAVAALTVFCPDGSRRVLLANLTRWSVEIILDDEDESVFEFGPYSSAWLDA